MRDNLAGARATDVDERLRRLAPSADPASTWDDATRDTVLATILAEDRPTRHRVPSRRVGLGVVACAAATVPLALSIGLPSHAPGGPSPAAALDRLATVAGASGPVIGPGQYLHRTYTTDVPYLAGVPMTPGAVRHGDRAVSHEETWSGRTEVWVRSAGPDARPCLEVVPLLGQVAEGRYDVAPASQLATLPTDPTRLASYIDEHPDGGNLGTTNTYAAATDLLWSGIATPQLRSAALNVLAQTPGLDGDEDATDDRGRPAIRIDHDTDGATQSVWFDPATAQIIETAGPTEGGDGSTTLIDSNVTDRLPDLPLCTPAT
jgi:hypothetical protein